MTVASWPPRVHRGSALPPGVPPPKKGELHMRVEGFDWQNMEFESRPPTCCSLLISWWGQANYNSLLMPLSASMSFSPVTAVFSVHCSAKHFERYLQDMGFLELTLVNGNTTFDLKDVSRSMIGKLSVSVSSLAEGHPVHGSYPIFANGHRLIGSMTLGITVTCYNREDEVGVGKYMGTSNSYRRDPRNEKGKPRIISSFERSEDLASAGNTIPLYHHTPLAGPLRQPTRRDVKVNSYSMSNSERSSGSPPLDREIKPDKVSSGARETSMIEEAVQKIVNKTLARTKSSEPKMTLLTVRDVGSSPLQQGGPHFRSANPYLDPSFCELDGLEFENADSLCESHDSSLSCVISKSARLIKSLACESGGIQSSVKSTNLSWTEAALKDSNRLKDLSIKGFHGTQNPMLAKGHDFPNKARKAPLKADILDYYTSVLERCAKDNNDVHSIYEKQPRYLSTAERIRSLRDITRDSSVNAVEGYEESKILSNLSTTERIRNLMDNQKDASVDAVEGYEERTKHWSHSSETERTRRLRDIPNDSAVHEGYEERKHPNSLSVPQAMQLYTEEGNRGGLPDLVVPSPAAVPRSTFDCISNPTFTPNTFVWRGRDEEEVAQKLKSKVVSSFERNASVPVRTMSLGTHPSLIPKIDFGFDPGGERRSSIPSVPIRFTQTRGTNLAFKSNDDRADRSDSCDMKGTSSSPLQRLYGPKNSFGIEPGKMNPSRSCSSPQAVINDIKQLIKRAEACRDTLKQPEFAKMRSMNSTTIPSAEKSRLSLSPSSHLGGLYSNTDDFLANILAANKNGHAEKQFPTKVLKDEDDIDSDDIDDASDVMRSALLEALYLDSDMTRNVSSDVGVEPAPSEASFGAIQHKIEAGRREVDWYDDYLKSSDGGLRNPIHWSDDDALNTSKYDDVPSNDHISAQRVDFPGSRPGQPFTLRVTTGKLVLCGPMVRDLADSRPSKGSVHSLSSTMQPTCTCSLTASFPAFIPPYSSNQRICISPVSFSTREVVFDHQAQLSWNLSPGHNLQDWQSRDLRVTVLFTWHRYDNLECSGYISLEKVVAAMPGVYRTSLALALASNRAHKRNRSNSPRRGRSLKVVEKQRMEFGLKQPTGSKRSSEKSEKLTSPHKDAVARVDVMLQLSHNSPVSTNMHESLEITGKIQRNRPLTINRVKPSLPRLLTNSTPVQGNSQDWWLHIILHDVVNCFENVLTSSQYSSKVQIRAPHLLLVVKSGPELLVQVSFPMKLGLHNQNLGNSTNGVLRAPAQLLKTRKAIIFIEVWHDAGVVNNGSKELESLVGLIKVPLTVVPGIVSPTDDLRRIAAKGGELVGEGLHQLDDPQKCTAVGTVTVVVTLGLSYQMYRLRNANRAAIVIQRHVREFLTRELGPNKSIEITRFWDTSNQRTEIKR